MGWIQGKEIRPAISSDYAGIMEIFYSWPNQWDPEYAERYYREFFGKDKCSQSDKVYILESEGKVVGTVGYCPDRHETDDVYWLGWFYVHKQFIRKGYGEELLRNVIEEVRAAGARKLYIDTSSDEFYSSARKLYVNIGFKKETKLEDYYGDDEDQVIYSLDTARHKECEMNPNKEKFEEAFLGHSLKVIEKLDEEAFDILSTYPVTSSFTGAEDGSKSFKELFETTIVWEIFKSYTKNPDLQKNPITWEEKYPGKNNSLSLDLGIYLNKKNAEQAVKGNGYPIWYAIEVKVWRRDDFSQIIKDIEKLRKYWDKHQFQNVALLVAVRNLQPDNESSEWEEIGDFVDELNKKLTTVFGAKHIPKAYENLTKEFSTKEKTLGEKDIKAIVSLLVYHEEN